jgi:hypothetical protein
VRAHFHRMDCQCDGVCPFKINGLQLLRTFIGFGKVCRHTNKLLSDKEYQMIEYLPQALSSLSVALDIGKGLVSVRDSAKLQEELIKFNSAIISAQSDILASQNERSSLTSKISDLEKECMRLKSWEAERKAYALNEITTGVFAYIKNDFVGEFKNAHKYCCNCFDNYKKSTLQQFQVTEGRKIGLSCHNKCPDLIFQSYKNVT